MSVMNPPSVFSELYIILTNVMWNEMMDCKHLSVKLWVFVSVVENSCSNEWQTVNLYEMKANGEH